MKNHPLCDRCPACGSTDLSNPLPFLYTTKPILCHNCGAKLEPRVARRIAFWLIAMMLFALAFFRQRFVDTFGEDALPAIGWRVSWLITFLIAGGMVLEIVRPWKLTPWDEQDRWRTVLNRGAVASIGICVAIFLPAMFSPPPARAFMPGPPPSRDEVASHVSSEEGVADYRRQYWYYAPHKAFAVSRDGAYGFSGELMSRPDHAVATALRYCERAREQAQMVAPCKVVDINGNWQP